jgi:hypothetical protein
MGSRPGDKIEDLYIKRPLVLEREKLAGSGADQISKQLLNLLIMHEFLGFVHRLVAYQAQERLADTNYYAT